MNVQHCINVQLAKDRRPGLRWLQSGSLRKQASRIRKEGFLASTPRLHPVAEFTTPPPDSRAFAHLSGPAMRTASQLWQTVAHQAGSRDHGEASHRQRICEPGTSRGHSRTRAPKAKDCPIGQHHAEGGHREPGTQLQGFSMLASAQSEPSANPLRIRNPRINNQQMESEYES